MTAAAREYAETGWKEDCIQSLAERLRSEADYNSMNDKDVREAMRRRLAVQAADWCKARRMPFSWDDVGKLADKAISRYIMNWKGKESGEDDRSHAFGSMCMKKDTRKSLQDNINGLY